MIESNINTWQSECTKTSYPLGYEKIHNICTGETVQIPWGAPEWMMFMGAATAAIVFIVAFVIAITLFWRIYSRVFARYL